MSKLLLLSASVGNGHVSAATALEAEARARGISVCNLDMMDLTSPGFRSWYAGGYETLVRRYPAVWGLLYRLSDRPLLTFQFQTLLDLFHCRCVEPILAREKPDWVVCTHSLPQPTLGRLRTKYGFRMAVCITDLHPHLMWLRGSPDHYFVPTEFTANALAARRPGSLARTTLSGMPIHSAFRPSEDVFAEPVVLVSSGGIGAGPIYDVIRSLSQLNCKTVVVAGRNRELYEELLARNLPDSVEVLGHIKLEEMAAQMKRSCLLVGKPGGLTTFESLAVGLPMVVFKPFVIPGQEEDNCRFLVDAGAGLVVDSIESLTSTVCELLGEPGKLDSMREAAMRNSRPNAVAVILDELFGGNSTGYGGVSENGGDGTSR